LRRIGVARHLAVTEREREIARPDLGEADPRHAENFLAARDALRAFELDAEQQFAVRIERPGVAQLAILRFRHAPDRRPLRLPAAAARAEPQGPRVAGVALGAQFGVAAQSLQRLRQIGVDAL